MVNHGKTVKVVISDETEGVGQPDAYNKSIYFLRYKTHPFALLPVY